MDVVTTGNYSRAMFPYIGDSSVIRGTAMILTVPTVFRPVGNSKATGVCVSPLRGGQSQERPPAWRVYHPGVKAVPGG